MTPDSKLAHYKHHLAAQGIGMATSFPPAWRLLWWLGLRMPPPPFLGFAPLAGFTGGTFALLFGPALWWWRNRGDATVSFEVVLVPALLAGAMFGGFMAYFYRDLARKHALGAWADYPRDAPRR